MFEVCVNGFSGELDREVVITVADVDGNAIGGYQLLTLKQFPSLVVTVYHACLLVI